MKKVLVIANQTVGGAALIEKVREKAKEGATFALVVPQNRPPHGQIIYDEAVRHAAEVRLSLARQFMSQAEGIEIEGDVGDEDPFLAAMDAIAMFEPDEVLVSTLPRTSSGWLRRDLVERIEGASGLPVEHVVVDVEKEGLPFRVTLVLANQTMGEAKLLERLKARTEERPHLFIVVVPQAHGLGHAAREARERLERTVRAFRQAGLLCAGMIGDPDPYAAARNALNDFRVDDVIVSTLPATRSGWLRGHLVERLREDTGMEIEHVEAPGEAPEREPEEAAA